MVVRSLWVRRWAVPALALMVGLALVRQPASVAAPAQPRTGGMLKVALTADENSLDMQVTTDYENRIALMNVMEPLLTLDQGVNLAPALAESWQVEGARIYTFHLRRGVRFHNGRAMTAEDVIYSLQRYKEKGGRRSDLAGIQSMEAPNPYTVRVTLQAPDGTFLFSLANPIAEVVIMPKGLAEEQGGTITKPVGTGPFQFVEWAPDRYLVVKRFAAYASWPGRPSGFAGAKVPYVDEVRFIPIKDTAVRANALATGDVDIADGLDYPSYTKLKSAPGLHVFDIPSYTITELRFGHKQSPMANLALRQAVAYAIDKKVLADGVTYGLGRPAPSVVLTGSSLWDGITSKDAGYDPAKARRLVAQSGYKGEVVKINVTPSAPLDEAAAVIIQSMLKAVGISAQINSMELAAWTQTWRTGTYDLFVNDLTMRPDPIAIYRPLWNSNSTPSGYNNPQWDRLTNMVATTTSQPQRHALIDQIHELQVQDLPFMPLFFSTVGQGYRDTVHGYEVWAAGYVRVWNVWTDR
jgi:peptide/nickel transport system substrate-binding protein